MYDLWFTIALLTSGFRQVWTKLGLKKSCTTLGEIVRLHNCAVADKGSIDKYYRELDKAGITKIARLHNCAVADITPHLWHDVKPQQRLKCKKMDGELT